MKFNDFMISYWENRIQCTDRVYHYENSACERNARFPLDVCKGRPAMISFLGLSMFMFNSVEEARGVIATAGPCLHRQPQKSINEAWAQQSLSTKREQSRSDPKRLQSSPVNPFCG